MRGRKLPYRPCQSARWVLDGVERWAENNGLVLLREIGIDSYSRLDGLLIPTSFHAPMMKKRTSRYYWYRAGVVGVEVKVSRADFLNGLRNGQYDRYDASLTGVYVASPSGVCKSSEIPHRIGHLIVNWKNDRSTMAVCRRHPEFQDPEFDQQLFWRILFRMMKESREGRELMRLEYKRKLERIGEIASEKVFHAIRKIQRAVEEE